MNFTYAIPGTALRSPAGNIPLVELQDVRQIYHKSDKAELVVLDGVTLTISAGEIVGLLGRSGSGKSTLLRIISGLLLPTAGSVRWRGEVVHGPCEGLAMVFQSFALFPWLTVLGNVELGLEAQGVPPAQGRQRALAAIDLIGLDGFESAYPAELSGGMRQRVGIARAIVVHPRLLLMDEPFSALDVLTAETLRTDIVRLWGSGRLPVQSILMVTHNIEEAVLMGDRLLVFSANPGRIATEIRVDLPRPRNRLDPPFRALVDDIYALMTETVPSVVPATLRGGRGTPDGIDLPLTAVSTNRLAGMMETLAAAPYEGRADLPDLAARLQMEADELFPAMEALQLLRFAVMDQGDVQLTGYGRDFARLDVDARKRLFGQQLLAHLPLVALICKRSISRIIAG